MATVEELVWQTDLNHAYNPPSLNDLGQFDVWYLKSLMTATGITLRDTSQNPIASPVGGWTVIGSSDGTTAALDGVDRWTTTYTPAKLIWCTADNSAQAHSWIVLKSPHAIPIYVLIQCLDSSGNKFQFHFEQSYSAFTGGSTTARPTGANQWYHHGPTSVVQHTPNTNNPHHWHGWLSTTGDVMLMLSRDGAGFFTKAHWYRSMVETEGAGGTPVATADGAPIVSYYEMNDSGGVLSLSSYFTGSVLNSFGWAGRQYVPANGAVILAVQCPVQLNGSVQMQASAIVNPNTGRARDFPSYLYCQTTSQNFLRGRIQDVPTLPNAVGANKVEPSSGPPFASVSVGNPLQGGYVAMPWPGMGAAPSL